MASGRNARKISSLLLLAGGAVGMTACAPQGATNTGAGDGGDAAAGTECNVGISMPTRSLERWINDGEGLKTKLEGDDCTVDLQYADNKTDAQISQIQNQVAGGAKILVVAAVDGKTLGPGLEDAKSQGVTVIAYDRLINGTDAVDYYATFDNYKVGTLQGEFIKDTLDLDNAAGPFTLEPFAGSPDDNNAGFFFGGAWDVLQPYVASGKLTVPSGKSPATSADWQQIGILSWGSDDAQAEMDNRLQSFYTGGQKVQVVLSPNDSLALGIEASLSSAGYAPGADWPVITGQDADKANVQAILADKQSMTVWKDTRALGDQVQKMIGEIVKGDEVTVNDTKSYDNGNKVVPSFLLDPQVVVKDDVQKTLIDSGFLKASDVGRASVSSRRAPPGPRHRPEREPGAAMDDVILQMTGIVKEFTGVRALDGVDVTVRRGEVHAVCGENGAGKSTLMKVLSGVYPHGSYEGTITIDGREVRYGSINDSERDGVVIIHQELALSPYLSIAENIFLGNEKSRAGVIDWNRTNLETVKLLERVGLDENPATRVLELGVGKQQLVEIAKALSKEVKLLILDEPTAALNDDDSAHLLELIGQLRDQGITSIIISHKLNEIRAIADEVTVIRDGRTIETFPVTDTDEIETRIIRAMVGRPLDAQFPPRDPHIGAEKLRVEDWTVHHPVDVDRVVVDNASFSVRAGEVVGFAGLMGAGRTELAMSIFGRSYGTGISGRIFKDGKEIRTRTVSEAIKNGIAYATEDRKRYGLNLIGSITVNVSAAALSKLVRLGVIDRNREYAVADDYRKKMNIKTPDVASVVGKLSGGNQQKVVLSKWIYSGPDVLILDEPTRGIDVGAKYEIYSIINQLAAEGKAVIVISSELPELIGLSDRIYTIAEGRLTAEVSRADATQEELMRHMTASRKSGVDQ